MANGQRKAGRESAGNRREGDAHVRGLSKRIVEKMRKRGRT